MNFVAFYTDLRDPFVFSAILLNNYFYPLQMNGLAFFYQLHLFIKPNAIFFNFDIFEFHQYVDCLFVALHNGSTFLILNCIDSLALFQRLNKKGFERIDETIVDGDVELIGNSDVFAER